jgi:hypothetical protein
MTKTDMESGEGEEDSSSRVEAEEEEKDDKPNNYLRMHGSNSEPT